MNKKFRIVFMGTPQFAVPTLQALLAEDNLEIVAVVTSPDRRGGRGQKQTIRSAVKQAALEAHLKLLQPVNLKAADFVEAYRDLKPDLAVVVAFRMLPEVIWSAPVFGTINLHASLLPAYRGAAPINWAIISGEKETGLTTFIIARDIDTGGIIFQEKVPISPDDTAGSLHDKLMLLGAPLVVRTVQAILAGKATIKEQDDSLATKAPKIFNADCQINPEGKVREICNFIRGLSPYPGAWLKIDGQVVKIFKCSYRETQTDTTPGSMITDGKKQLLLYGSDGYLAIEELQMEGKKKLDVRSFLNGYDINQSRDISLKIS